MRRLEIGQTASFAKTITESDVSLFAGLSGDFNSIHVNAVAAEKGMFGKRIAHGMLVGSLISTVIGTKLPGEGTVYLEQDMRFLKPVYIGDTCTASVKVAEVMNYDKGIYRLNTRVENQKDEDVISGIAVVKYM